MPRHLFVDEAMANRAYEDCALPIGFGQTISQPFIVARMTERLLGNDRSAYPKRVLEVGTGSGYQAAILAMIVEDVYTVERIQDLFKRTRDLLNRLQFRNVHTKHSDGTWGWPEEAPFDAIMATAAPEQVPESLLEQLAINGRLIIPVGATGHTQFLKLITRTEDGYDHETFEAVSFVPFCTGVTN